MSDCVLKCVFHWYSMVRLHHIRSYGELLQKKMQHSHKSRFVTSKRPITHGSESKAALLGNLTIPPDFIFCLIKMCSGCVICRTKSAIIR